MKKWLITVLVFGLFCCGCVACGKKNDTETGEQQPVAENSVNEGQEAEPTQAPTEAPIQAPAETKPQEEKEPMKENQEVEIVEGIVDKIPVKDTYLLYVDCGKIEEITYQTKDYYGDGSEITKTAFVYLPKDYDETKQYNVLYLMHGIGGDEKEWGMFNSSSKVKAMMDNLIQKGAIEPFIVVAANGRSGADFANRNADYNAFYKFGQELRNDLIPYIDANFATYAEYDENGYDLTAARDHRAMAGLSMGGMQTTNIGMCECLDIISWFGAFSAAPTTYPADKIAECVDSFEGYDINYYYAMCGTEDGIAFSSAQAAVTGLTEKTDKFVEGENFTWQTLPGAHDFNIWYLGYYNFARLVFK